MKVNTLGALALATLLALPIGAQEGVTEGAREGQIPVVEQAVERIEAGDLATAISILEAVGAGDDRVDALLGALYVETGRASEGFQRLAPLALPDTADPAVLYNAGRAALALGQLDDARAFLGRSAQMAPGSPAGRDLGVLLSRMDLCREGYVHLQPWARAHPQDAVAQFEAARCAIELERAPEAEAFLSSLPQDADPVRLLWGELLLMNGDPWGALAMLKPLAERPEEEIGMDLRRLLAEGYLTVGQSSSAVELLEGRVGDDPSLALFLTSAYYQSGDLDHAIGTIEPIARSLATSDPAAAQVEPAVIAAVELEYGRLLVVGGRPAEALVPLGLATRLRPDNPEGWQYLSQAMTAAGRSAEAEQALQRFQDLTASQGRGSLDEMELAAADPAGREIRRGFQLVQEGAPTQALEVAQQEIVLAPGDFRPYLLEALALLTLDRGAEALVSAERALELAPDNADAYYQRGMVQMALGNPEQALSDLRQAIAIAPDHTAAMNDLAILLLSRGSRDEARTLLQRVLELRPGDQVAAENLALIGETSPDS